MWAADLFFALNDPTDGDRQLTVSSPQGTHRCQAGRDPPLVVRHAARVQLVVAHRWLKGRRVPQVKRVGRLDVIVVIEQQRERAAAPLFAIDRRRRALYAEALRAETGLDQQRFDQIGRLVHPQALRRDTRLATELFEQ